MARFEGIKRLLHIQRDGAGIERAVNDELQFHFDMTMRDLMNGGMNPEDARREAQRRFGDVERTRERLATIDRARAGQERRAEWWSAFAQDLRYALRGLRLKPGFALAVIVTLGLGIGANATMFGIVDRLLFRPPNMLTAPERTNRIYLAQTFRGKENVNSWIGYRRFLDLQELTTSFDAMTPFYYRKLAIGTGTAAKEMNVGVGGSDLWKMFDVKPVLGRLYGAEDNRPEAPTNVIVLSYGYWQTQFGGRKDALGATMDIGANKYTVIGVAPEGFSGFVSQPLIGFITIAANMQSRSANPTNPWQATYNMTWFESFARRKPGVSVAAATADLSQASYKSYQRQLEKNPKNTPINLAKPRGLAGPLLADAGPNASNESKVATWLGGVALIVLLIACANVANLLLARALRRRREIAVRVALGISRGRLLMQLMVESLLLAVLSAFAGLAVAQWGGAILRRALLDQTTTPSALTDTRMLGFIALLAAVVGLLTGLAPALQAGRADVAATLKAGAREGTVHRSRLRIGLLVTQAALSVVLLVGAGLFVRSLMNVQQIRLGYDIDPVMYVDINSRGVKIDSAQSVLLQNALMERARATPGVVDAARALTVPYWSSWSQTLSVPGIDSVSKLGQFTLQAGSPSIFATMGTRILRGRGLAAEDRAGAPLVMVVNEAMAKKLWPNDDPIGKCVRVGNDTTPCRTVVGVAENIRPHSLSDPEMHYYMSIDQFQPQDAGIFVRTRGPAVDQVDAVRRALQPAMPGVSYVTATAMSTIMSGVFRPWKLGATMFAIFGGLALVLAAIGLYSVIAYNVTQRTHEMGVRVALGAQARDVIRLIVREGLFIVVPGVVLGAIIALVAGKWIAPLLFQVSPKDPPVIVAVIVTLIAVAIAASWVPATRAARVDPNEALRAD